MNNEIFPPDEPHPDKAKYRQFLIDHGLDPNLNGEGLQRQFAALSERERDQSTRDWAEFLRDA